VTALAPHPRRSAARGALRALSSVLIVSGLLLLADAGLSVFWQEPLSALYNRLQQDSLDGQLSKLDDVPPTPVERRALQALPDVEARMAFRARSLDRKVKDGQAIGRLRIPRIGVSKVVVEGTGAGDLRTGPGHYPDTPLPGAPGTVAIAGHRTTYGAPLRHVDRVRKGDRIEVQMPYGRFEYTVERVRIVPPSAVWVTRRVGYDRLVLTACHPLYSAAQRIVVFARLRSSKPSAGLT
jgi:sortase A